MAIIDQWAQTRHPYLQPEPLAKNTQDSHNRVPKHYQSTIDPYAYALANSLNFLEANIVKYVTRWIKKDGLKDLLKARDTLDRLIQHAHEKGY